MRKIFSRKGSALAVWAITLVALSASLTMGLAGQATGRSMPLHGADAVNVNVSFQTRMPLADLSEKTLADTQRRGRTFIYNMASDECDVLKATIARTCRLTSINVSARIQDNYNQTPVRLYLNGSARLTISLKNP